MATTDDHHFDGEIISALLAPSLALGCISPRVLFHARSMDIAGLRNYIASTSSTSRITPTASGVVSSGANGSPSSSSSSPSSSSNSNSGVEERLTSAGLPLFSPCRLRRSTHEL